VIDVPFPEVSIEVNDEVKTSDWFPNHPPMQYPAKFISWVNSINEGWRKRKTYEPFEIYKAQVIQHMKHKDDITDYSDEEEQLDFIYRERERCRDNTLYFANRYGKIKEGDIEGGGMDYEAWKAQEVILFLADCWYNYIIGKARQIGFTTTEGLLASKRINFFDSYFVKFITHTKEKGEEIFRDKIRWAFGMIPDWFREKVYNDSHNMLSLQERSKKGSTDGSHSRIEVVTPKVDAINGGSPNLTLIDEIGLIPIFTRMMKEGRPTLFFFNPKTKRMEMRRQLIAWGTGGEMDKAGAVFEAEFKAALKAWRERSFHYGIVPLFFDCFAREGMTEEIYRQEKKVYYAVTGMESERSRVQFHQHYPITIDDMFLRTAKTMIPISEINKHLLRIYQLPDDQSLQYGYFEPKYDGEEKLVSASWTPTEGSDDQRTTTCIFQHPQNDWDYRYYQGTDPINSETGHSKMSSSIWDAYTNTIPAMMFWRTAKFKECYMQSLLMGLYYDPRNNGCKELIENNIGDMYLDFQEELGFGKRIQSGSILPPFMQASTGKWWGISNKTNTAGHIANKAIEMLDSYASNIWIPWMFLQLKTFVEKDLKGSLTQRQTRFQAADLRYDYDDAIYGGTFSYLNAQCNQKYIPKCISEVEAATEFEKRYVQSVETNFKLRLAEVNKKTGKVRRFISGTV